MPGNRCCLPIVAALALTGSALHPGSVAAVGECRGEDGLNTPVVHGTVQAASNDEGQLVLALDRALPGKCRPDGRAELVFLFQSRARDGAAGLAGAAAAPVTDATVEHRDGWIRVTLPGEGRWLLKTPRARAAIGGATAVEGLAVSRVDRGIRATGLEATLAEYRDFELLRGPNGA